MDDYSKYCTCSPIFTLPTREDLLHPQSRITHEELIKFRTMQGFIKHEKKTKYSELEWDENRDFKCAEAGLAHYNKINSANYKLIEATKSHVFFCGWMWYHCVFKAAPETSSEPELFFAELHALESNYAYHVLTVAPVTSGNFSPRYPCWYCKGNNIPHPVWTLSRDPDLLYSEGKIDIGMPSDKLHYQQAVQSLKKIYASFGAPYHCDYQQKLSISKEVLEQFPEIKKMCTGGFGFKGASSDLKPIFRNSNNEMKEHGPGTPPSVGGKQVGQEHEKGPDLPLADVDVDVDVDVGAAPKEESGHVKRMIQSMEDNITRNTN